MTIFKRNLTSKILEDTALEVLSKKSTCRKCLEVGCGDFNISSNLFKNFPSWSFSGSDISDEAINIAVKNDIKNIFDLRVGELFEPWVGEKFDIIISDVASISEVVASYTDWYDGVSCNTGLDGMLLIEKIIISAKDHLLDDGVFIIPYISISDVDKQKKILEENFSNVEYVNEKEWPLDSYVATQLQRWSKKNSKKYWTLKKVLDLNVAFTGAAIAYY
jgi:methylase of polypeptide subunit release factors